MIKQNDIINFLQNYKIDSKFTFYKECIDKIKEVKDEYIHKIKRVTYLLDPIRLYLLNNIDNYRFILSRNKFKDCTYVKIRLDNKEIDNFLTLLELMENYKSNVLELNNVNIQNIKQTLSISDTVYLNIIEKDKEFKLDNYIEIKNYYDTLSFLLTIETINILKYQRIDRIRAFLKDPEALKVYTIMQNYNNYIHTLSFQERDKYLIHSGSLFSALGTTYTRDVDVIVAKLDQNVEQTKTFLRDIYSKYDDLDISVLNSTGDYYLKPDEEPLKYKKHWFTYQLPALDGAKDIYDVLSNSVFHFYFLGMKFMNVNLSIYRFLQRASVSSMADLIMLKDINKINVGDKLCLPNITIRQGRLVVFYGKYLETYFNSLQKALKEYYNKDYSLDELKKLIKHCNAEGFDIYKGIMVKDPDTDIIKYFHIMIKKNILGQYARNINYLLDVGSGKLTDMRIWQENNIKNVVGIEPSIESIKMGEERLKQHGFTGKLDVINGVGNIDWTKDKKYKIALDNKYDVITFQFTLHYMMNEIDIVIDNLKKVMKSGTKIIITCMDGNKIHNDFKRYKHVEVRNRQEPIFAIIPMYEARDNIPEKDNNIIVYFKGAYGVSSGSIEPIIDIEKLIKVFNENNIKLLEKKNFADYNIDIKKRMHPIQLRVSSYYMSLVFENQ